MKSHLFEKGIEYGSDLLEQLHDGQLDNPTPCSEWNVRQLLNHMIYEIAWVPELLGGKRIEDVGDKLDGDLVGDDPVKSWEHYATLALAAVQQADKESTVHLSYGDGPAARYVNEVGGDVIIHSWDLAKGLGQDFHIDGDLTDDVIKATEHVMPMAREYNLIAKQKDVKSDSTDEAKLLAVFGRDIGWRP
jgi:uncharacterized protein (TIGR03086 family)